MKKSLKFFGLTSPLDVPTIRNADMTISHFEIIDEIERINNKWKELEFILARFIFKSSPSYVVDNLGLNIRSWVKIVETLNDPFRMPGHVEYFMFPLFAQKLHIVFRDRYYSNTGGKEFIEDLKRLSKLYSKL